MDSRICLAILKNAAVKLQTSGILPYRVFLSETAHSAIVLELTGGKNNAILYEILDLPVIIDPECPAGAGYIEGIG